MAETLTHAAGTTEPTQLHYVTVDQSFDAEQAARDAARDRLTQELNEGGRAKRFLKTIWKGGALKEYYQLKYERQALENIQHADNVLLFQATEEQGTRAKMATIERFLHEDDAMIHRDAKEDRQEVASDSDLAREVKNLIRQNVQGTLSDQAMLEERTRLMNAYHESHGENAIGAGRMRVDNMLDIAAAVKGAIDHGESLDSVIGNMKISMGEARSGVRTEAKYNWVEKMADKMSKSKVGSLIGPEVVASATTVAASVLRFGSHSVVGALTKTVLPGAAAGLWAGLRENKRMKDDREQHMRDMAMGKEIGENSSRREGMEETRYATASATELISTLGEHFNDEKPLDTKDAYETALAALGAVEARIRLSDSQNIDLISYSNAGAVEEERLLLDIARAQAKVAAEARLDPAMRALLGVNDTVALQTLITERSEAFLASVEEDQTQKDRVFAKMKRRAVVKAAAKGAITGILIGATFQEGLAAVSDTRTGLVEQAWGADNQPYEGTMHQTLAHGLFNGEHGPGHVGPADTYVDHHVGTNGNFNLSSDQSLVKNPDGTITIENAKGDPIIEGLTTDENGGLSKESIAQMRAAGLTVEDLSHMEDLPPLSEEHDGTLDDYLDRHSKETVNITRTGWEDNGTPDIFEGDELGLHLGGENGSGIQADGSYQFNISTMSPDTWKSEAEAGNIKLAISASADSQTDVFMVDVNPDGTVNIPEDSPAAAFMKEEGGEAKFIGKYAEVVHVDGVNEDGVTEVRPVATLIGEDSARGGNFPISEEVPRQQLVPEYKITSPGYDTPADFTEMAPVIPVVPRRSLERVTRGRERLDLKNPNLEGFYYGGGSLESVRKWLAEDPGRLRTRTQVEAADGSSSWLEADGTLVERSVDRERSVLQSYLDKQRAINPEHYRMVESVANDLGSMEKGARVTVNVPAWMEEGNLEHFLSEYTAQVGKDGAPLDPALFEVNILINRKTGAVPDGSVAVIKKFIRDFESTHGFRPRVNYSDVELDPPFNNVGYARKLLTDAVMLRSLQRSDQEDPLYIETEDADMLRIDKKTVVNLIDKLDKNPHLDAVRGVQDRSPEYMMNNDMLFLRRRAADFFEILASQKALRDPKNPNWNFTWNRVVTGGWNTGYTAESYGLIDGYDSVRTGEDMSIGEKITMLRGDGSLPNLEVIGKVGSRSDSSPRRFIHEILTDKGAYADDNFSDEEANKIIREKTLDEALDSIDRYRRIDASNEGAFTGFLEWMAGNVKAITPTKADSDQLTRRLMFWIGFDKNDYEIVGDGVRIKSWDNVKQSLDTYRARRGVTA